MRKRYGLASDCDNGASAQALAEKTVSEPDKVKGEAAVKKKRFGRLDMVAAAATLTLSIIRVVREASDLYRKISQERDGAGT